MIGAANDVRDAHVDVVHDHAELVRGHAVRAQQDEIFDVRVLHFARAEDGVFEFRRTRARRLEANRVGNSGSIFLGALRVREIAARARRGFEGFYFGVSGGLRGRYVLFRFFVLGVVRCVIAAGVGGAFAVARKPVAFGENALRGGA